VVAGQGEDGRWYVLGDYTCQLSPEGWARRVKPSYKISRISDFVKDGGPFRGGSGRPGGPPRTRCRCCTR
jgi:phage terminase large subunit-like protein